MAEPTNFDLTKIDFPLQHAVVGWYVTKDKQFGVYLFDCRYAPQGRCFTVAKYYNPDACNAAVAELAGIIRTATELAGAPREDVYG